MAYIKQKLACLSNKNIIAIKSWKLSETDRVAHGPMGEYYLLSTNCYKYRSPSYMYELCPYVRATQDDGINPTPTKLGAGGVLDLSDSENPKVTFNITQL